MRGLFRLKTPDHYPADLLAVALPHMCAVPDELIQSGTYFKVSQGGQVVGAGGWSINKLGLPEVRKLGVRPTALRQGVATSLVHHICATARAAKHSKLHCASSLNAVPFYISCGFTEIGTDEMTTPAGDFQTVTLTLDLVPTAHISICP